MTKRELIEWLARELHKWERGDELYGDFAKRVVEHILNETKET